MRLFRLIRHLDILLVGERARPGGPIDQEYIGHLTGARKKDSDRSEDSDLTDTELLSDTGPDLIQDGQL